MTDQDKTSKLSEGLCAFLRSEVLSDDVEMDENSSLENIGVDSYSLMEIILYVERDFGISIPMEILTPDNTQSVKTLVACIQGIGPA